MDLENDVICVFWGNDWDEGTVFVEVQEEINIAVRNTTKYAILMNFMVVILNRGLDKNNQLLSDNSNM